MTLAGITAILLPCIVSGYLLANARPVRIMLPETPGANFYFRVLVTGFLWVLFCSLLLVLAAGLHSMFPESLGQLVAGAAAQLAVEWLFFAAGVGAVLLAAALRLFLDLVVYRIWHPQILAFGDRAIKPSEQQFNLRILDLEARHLEVLARKAMENRKMIIITMSNDEIRIGWPTSTKNPKKPRNGCISVPWQAAIATIKPGRWL